MTFLPVWSCPAHGRELREIAEALVCPDGESYPIRDGIPRFVGGDGYAAAFGLQWQVFRKTQLDSHTGTTISRDRLRRCLGPLWDELAGKSVLECGCGAGRFTEVLLERGAIVASVDLSSAVDANAETAPVSPRHCVAQCDIERLPFAPRQFDIVMCLGVIQHTPSPERTIARLAEQVRPGGWLVIDHYTWSLAWFLKPSPFVRQVVRRLGPATALRVTRKLVDTFLPLHARTRQNRALHALVGRISPVQSYYRAHPELPDQLQREWAMLDTYDSLSDHYKHFRTRGQIRAALAAQGLVSIWCERGGNGIEARAMRPVPKGT